MSFRIKLNESMDVMVEAIKSKAMANGGTFSWDGSVGQLSVKTHIGKLEGNCKLVSEQEMEVSITKKPFIISESMIKNQIEEYLRRA
ncbi:MAG: hypothetical protein FWC26_00845 [Fibromonadales bacterium]|nr:hypothetical protein [Fibromonadales bacterium]